MFATRLFFMDAKSLTTTKEYKKQFLYHCALNDLNPVEVIGELLMSEMSFTEIPEDFKPKKWTNSEIKKAIIKRMPKVPKERKVRAKVIKNEDELIEKMADIMKENPDISIRSLAVMVGRSRGMVSKHHAEAKELMRSESGRILTINFSKI